MHGAIGGTGIPHFIEQLEMMPALHLQASKGGSETHEEAA